MFSILAAHSLSPVLGVLPKSMHQKVVSAVGCLHLSVHSIIVGMVIVHHAVWRHINIRDILEGACAWLARLSHSRRFRWRSRSSLVAMVLLWDAACSQVWRNIVEIVQSSGCAIGVSSKGEGRGVESQVSGVVLLT